MYDKVQRRVYQILEEPATGLAGRAVQLFLIAIILMNVAVLILATVDEYRDVYLVEFGVFEVFSVAVFTVEYLLRMWVAPLRPALKDSRSPRLRYIFTPMAIVDLCAILPFYLPLATHLDLRFVRVLRLMRLVRLLKLGRYSESMQVLMAVLNDRKEQLLAAFMIVVLAVVLSSGVVYFVEHDAQPTVFKDWPSSMWWAVATLTTAGYANMYPITVTGKIVSCIISILGIGLFALPAGILGSGFVEAHQRRRNPPKCPHCGKDLTAPPDSHNHNA